MIFLCVYEDMRRIKTHFSWRLSRRGRLNRDRVVTITIFLEIHIVIFYVLNWFKVTQMSKMNIFITKYNKNVDDIGHLQLHLHRLVSRQQTRWSDRDHLPAKCPIHQWYNILQQYKVLTFEYKASEAADAGGGSKTPASCETGLFSDVSVAA